MFCFFNFLIQKKNITVLNVAIGKAAMQSSTVGQGHAQKAVDGSKYPLFFFITNLIDFPKEKINQIQTIFVVFVVSLFSLT